MLDIMNNMCYNMVKYHSLYYLQRGAIMLLGEQIRAARQSKKISVKALAEAVGVNTNTMYMYERDERTPSDDTLNRIKNVLGADCLQTFHDEGIAPPYNGENLKDIRKEYRFTLSELATKTGIDEKTLQQYENDLRRIDLYDMDKILTVLSSLGEVKGNTMLTLYGADGMHFNSEVACPWSERMQYTPQYRPAILKLFDDLSIEGRTELLHYAEYLREKEKNTVNT